MSTHPLSRRLRVPALALTTAGLALAGLGVAGPASAAPPTNDNLASATALTLGTTLTVSTDEATKEAGEDRGGVPGSATSTANRTVWYRYTPAANQTVGFRASSTGDNADTYFTLFSGPAAGQTFAGLTFVKTNDDSSGYYSYISAALVGGTTYYLQVDTYNADTPKGSFALRLEAPPGAPTAVPGNDSLASASRLVPNLDSAVDNRLATTEGAEPNSTCNPPIHNSVWFTYTPAVNRTFEVDTTGALGSVVNVWSGPAGATAAQLTAVSCDWTTEDSSPNVTGVAGTHYYVQVGSPTAGGSARPFTVNVDQSWDYVSKVTATGTASGATLNLTATAVRDPYVGETPPATALTGSVEFLDGTKSLGSAPINAAGVATVAVPRPSAGAHAYLAVFVSGDPLTRDTFRALSVTVPKGTSTVTAKAPKKVTIKAKIGKNGKPVIKPKKVKVRATVGSNGLPATGQVSFKVGKKTVKGTLKNGVVTVKVKVRKTTKVLISYAGDANTAPSSTKVKIKVVIKKP